MRGHGVERLRSDDIPFGIEEEPVLTFDEQVKSSRQTVELVENVLSSTGEDDD